MGPRLFGVESVFGRVGGGCRRSVVCRKDALESAVALLESLFVLAQAPVFWSGLGDICNEDFHEAGTMGAVQLEEGACSRIKVNREEGLRIASCGFAELLDEDPSRLAVFREGEESLEEPKTA